MFKRQTKQLVIPILIVVIGLGLIGTGLSFVLKKKTENQVASKALMLIETMNSVRNYTSKQVKPELIERLNSEFLPQTIPAYSAREVFEGLRLNSGEFSELRYKEAVLNPSNLRDKANRWEKPIVAKFRENKDIQEQRGFFEDVAAGQLFYLARPIKITKASCLQCHSSPDVAPKTVIEKYGSSNGMGWHLNEIVGAQIITIPAKTLISQAHQSLVTIMAMVSIIWALVVVIVNYLLNQNLIKPLRKTARIAEEASYGYMDIEFKPTTNDDINRFISAFERIKKQSSN